MQMGQPVAPGLGPAIPGGAPFTPFSSLKESLWTPRSLATHLSFFAGLPGPEACWLASMGRLRVP